MKRGLLALALLWACGSEQSSRTSAQQQRSIVGGEIDTNTPAVVELRVSGALHCTGSLIGAKTVITAAHCALPAGHESLLTVGIEPGAGAGPTTRRVRAEHLHPDFDQSIGVHDLMLLELEDPVGGVTPLSLYPRLLGENDLGRELRVLGYGATQASSGVGSGVRREVMLTLRQLQPLRIEAGDSGKQACVGDSGGPALLPVQPGGTEYVVATVSEGDQSCQSSAFYARVDIDVEWIASTAAAWDFVPTCATAGSPDCPQASEPEPGSGCSTADGAGWLLITLLGASRWTRGKGPLPRNDRDRT